MTISNEKSPLTAATANEETKSIPERSIATAYLANPREGTRDTFGTWSGTQVPKKDHMTLIVSIKSIADMIFDGPALVQINPECIEANNKAVEERKRRDNKKKQDALRSLLDDHFRDGEFQERVDLYERLEEEVWGEIDARVEAIMSTFGDRTPTVKELLNYIETLEDNK